MPVPDVLRVGDLLGFKLESTVCVVEGIVAKSGVTEMVLEKGNVTFRDPVELRT